MLYGVWLSFFFKQEAISSLQTIVTKRASLFLFEQEATLHASRISYLHHAGRLMAGMTREPLYVDGVAQGLHPPVVPLNSRPEPRRVDHTYRDFSRFLCPAEHLGGEQSGRKAQKANFPAKLHIILSTPAYFHVSRCCGLLLFCEC